MEQSASCFPISPLLSFLDISLSLPLSLFFSLDRFSPALSWAIYFKTYRSPLTFLNSRSFKKLFHLHTYLFLKCGCAGERGQAGAVMGTERLVGCGGGRWAFVLPWAATWPCPGLQVPARLRVGEGRGAGDEV